MIHVLASFVLGALLSLYTTPLMRRAALQFGIVDRPDGSLKRHAEPVPYLGGLAVFLSYLITLGVTFDFSHEVLGLLLSGTLVLIVGLIDDLGVLSPLEKLAGQILAVAVLFKSGIFIQLVFLPLPLALAISALWLLTVTNALNIIDIMDGLAPGAAAIAGLFLSIAASLSGLETVAVLSAALAGSLFGFLRFNFQPARIYLGDSGSLFIGLTLGALAMKGVYTDHHWLGMLTPVVLLGIPLFDLGFVIVVRWLRGLSPFRGSPDHFALRLRRAGFTVRQTVLTAYGVGAVFGLFGLGLMQASGGRAWAIAGLLGAGTLAAGVWLWHKGSE